FDGRYRMVLVPGLYRLRLLPPASTGLDSVVFQNVAIGRDTTIDVDYAIQAGGGGGASPVVRFAPRGNPTHTRAAVSLVLNRPVASALLEVFDVAGRRARVIYSGSLGVGTHTLPWDGRRENGAQAHTGVYLVRAQLDERLVVVFDAQVHDHVVPRLAARHALHDQHRRGLPAADVATRALGGFQRLHESLGKVAFGALVCGLHRRPHLGVGHEVRL